MVIPIYPPQNFWLQKGTNRSNPNATIAINCEMLSLWFAIDGFVEVEFSSNEIICFFAAVSLLD